ncbi:6-phosphofructokinase [Halarsenatibacter silvermanii]|uniref:ATP-dependent 6-phosphofructokinase n=2 Tax=Halarsenatibacter silvermanii TaxID=321763 RepID=A0A1G9NJI7_9FIRM|nr:ATP-dependent 6-phosphofructokinase [Halarsenatibacter silvermanii]SDL86167.1 6-phosphofructokinase [Halarsenatibacter silvermanii]
MGQMERIGVMTSGGDAPGMNAAVRAITRWGKDAGLDILGIKRGYAGLLNEEIIPLSDSDVSGKVNRGGTFLLTARSEKFRSEEGQQKALEMLHKNQIDGLIVIGGDGSMRGAKKLEEKGFPTAFLPGTIDNDIPCTDYSIGFDTAINTVTNIVDKIRDTATSHERVFIIETMGRHSGVLTLEAGLAAGAEAVLIPEIKFDIEEVCRIVAKGYDRGKLHNLILVAEGVDYTHGESYADRKNRVVFEIGKKIESRTGHEVREIVLGHVQRGGAPSAKDRILASKMGSRVLEGILEGKSGMMVAKEGNLFRMISYEKVLNNEVSIDKSLYELAHIIG